MKLELQNAICGYPHTPIIRDLNICFNQGEIVCILGANGIGKTTIFRSILGFLDLLGGKILLDSVEREKLSSKEFSKSVGYVPQSHEMPFAYKVKDVVVMGRTSHLGKFSTPGLKEYMITYKVLEMLGISYLREKDYTRISGGERQMVLIARSIVQEPKILVMDEPTANLDLGNQVKVLENIKSLSKVGLGVIMTTHNPDHAFLCADKVILVTKDRKIKVGTVDEIVTKENLSEAYGVDVKITETQDEIGHIIKSCVPMLKKGQILESSMFKENFKKS